MNLRETDRDKRRPNSLTIDAKVGDEVKIRLINANPALYKYSFNVTEESIDYSSQFVIPDSILASLKKAVGTESLMSLSEGARIRHDDLKVPFQQDTDLLNLIQAIVDLGKVVKESQEVLVSSDVPIEKEEAYLGNRTEFQQLAMKSPLINVSNYANKISEASKAFKSSLEERSASEKNAMEILHAGFSLVAEQLISESNKLNQLVSKQRLSEQPSKTIKVTENKRITITISIEALNINESPLRATGKDIVKVIINPEYSRPVLEFIPTGTLALPSGNYSRYFLREGVISEATTQKAVLNPGLIVNANLPGFGTNKVLAVGLGAGISFSSSGKPFESMFVASTLSLVDVFRVSIGYGQGQFPSRLADGFALGSPLTTDISDLNDIIIYEGRKAVFISLSVLGLTF